MISRKVVLWCVGGALLVLSLLNAANWLDRLQMSADTSDALAGREAKRAEREAKRVSETARKLPSVQPDKLTREGWETIALRLRETGLTDAEAETLIAAVKDQLPTQQTGQEAYFVPA